MAIEKIMQEIKRLSNAELHQLMQFLTQTITPTSSQEPVFNDIVAIN